MPTFYDAVNYVKEINDETWVILKKILSMSKYYERIPMQKLIESVPFSRKLVSRRINILQKKGFIEYFKQPYESVRLLTLGLDLIALKKLTDRDLIVGVGRQIGTGKESDIYEVISPEGEILSLKIFRLGRISFRHVRTKREYGPSQVRISWHYRNISAAKKEFENLKYVYRKGVSVPRPIYHVLHMILMERLDGLLLNDIREVENPVKLFTNIIYEVKKTYDNGVVNGDLSQFNIFLSKDGRVYLIDWPQAVSINDRKSLFLLKKDLLNISCFFIKKYEMSVESVLNVLKTYSFGHIISDKDIQCI